MRKKSNQEEWHREYELRIVTDIRITNYTNSKSNKKNPISIIIRIFVLFVIRIKFLYSLFEMKLE